MRLYKKGNFFDGIFIFIILFLIVVAVSCMYYAFSPVQTELAAAFTADGATDSAELLTHQEASFANFWDVAFIMLFVFMVIALLISTFYLDNGNALVLVAFVMLSLMFFIYMLLGNTFEELVTGNFFSAFPTDFPLTYYLLTHSVPVGAAVILVVALGLFAKQRFMS